MADNNQAPLTLVEQIVDLVRTIAIALLIALVIRTLFIQPFHIPSASMRPGLQEGDYILVSKFSYGYSKYSVPFGWFALSGWDGRIMGSDPERGDVAVFRNPSNDREDFIKRVIGLPGDKISIADGKLTINGEAADYQDLSLVTEAVLSDDRRRRRNVTYQQISETLPGGHNQVVQEQHGPYQFLQSTCISISFGGSCNTQEITIPENQFLMMGDNRDNSKDSRFPDIGLVPRQHFVGEAQLIVFSWRNLTRLFRVIR